MFIDRLRRLNPGLVQAAMELHQAGSLRANTYLLDLEGIAANTRLIRAEADALGLRLYAMTKQFGRNPDACDVIVDAGIETAVTVDIQCLEAVRRSRMRIGHAGHLVQPHRGTEDAVIVSRPEIVTVFHESIAERLGAAAVRAGVARVPATARVAARLGSDTQRVVVADADERAWLSERPLSVLPIEEKLLLLLQGVGIETCGALAALEREAVEVRFGPELVEFWQHARGEDRRHLFQPIPPEAPHAGGPREPRQRPIHQAD